MSSKKEQAAAATNVRARLGRLEIESSVSVACSPQAAWDVITDYDRLGSFMPSFESRRVGRTDRGELVRQTGGSSLSKRLRFGFVLEFVRESPESLRFRQVMGNLLRYEGDWRVDPAPGGVRISYRASAVHGFPLRGRILASLVRTDFEKIMPAIVAEIERRAIQRPAGSRELRTGRLAAG